MKPVNFDKYRECVLGLDIPVHEMDEIIDVVHSILSFFVDQAFHVQTDQITMQSVGKSFNGIRARDTIENHPENQSADAPRKGIQGDSKPIELSEP